MMSDIENTEEYTLGDEYRIVSPTPEDLEWYEKVKNLLESDRFVWLSSETQVDTLAGLIGCKAQQALYEIVKETNPAVWWEEFVMVVRSNRRLRKAIKAVAEYAAFHFDMSKLDFNLPADALEYVDDGGEARIIESSRIFDKTSGECMITVLLMQAEMEYFKRLHKSNPQYTWDVYRRELKDNKEMWLQFCRTFQHGLRQIDFMASWHCRDIPETEYLRRSEG